MHTSTKGTKLKFIDLESDEEADLPNGGTQVHQQPLNSPWNVVNPFVNDEMGGEEKEEEEEENGEQKEETLSVGETEPFFARDSTVTSQESEGTGTGTGTETGIIDVEDDSVTEEESNINKKAPIGTVEENEDDSFIVSVPPTPLQQSPPAPPTPLPQSPPAPLEDGTRPTLLLGFVDSVIGKKEKANGSERNEDNRVTKQRDTGVVDSSAMNQGEIVFQALGPSRVQKTLSRVQEQTKQGHSSALQTVFSLEAELVVRERETAETYEAGTSQVSGETEGGGGTHLFANRMDIEFQTGSTSPPALDNGSGTSRPRTFFIGFRRPLKTTDLSGYVLKYCFQSFSGFNQSCETTFVFDHVNLKRRYQQALQRSDPGEAATRKKRTFQLEDQDFGEEMDRETRRLFFPRDRLPEEVLFTVLNFEMLRYSDTVSSTDPVAYRMLETVAGESGDDGQKERKGKGKGKGKKAVDPGGSDPSWGSIWKTIKSKVKTSAKEALRAVLRHPLIVGLVLLISRAMRSFVCVYLSGISYDEIKGFIRNLLQKVFGTEETEEEKARGGSALVKVFSCLLTWFASCLFPAAAESYVSVLRCIKDLARSGYRVVSQFLQRILDSVRGSIVASLSRIQGGHAIMKSVSNGAEGLRRGLTSAYHGLRRRMMEEGQGFFEHLRLSYVQIGKVGFQAFLRNLTSQIVHNFGHIFLVLGTFFFPYLSLALLVYWEELQDLYQFTQVILRRLLDNGTKRTRAQVRTALLTAYSLLTTSIWSPEKRLRVHVALNSLYSFLRSLFGCALGNLQQETGELVQSLLLSTQRTTDQEKADLDPHREEEESSAEDEILLPRAYTCCLKELVQQFQDLLRSFQRSSPSVSSIFSKIRSPGFLGMLCTESEKMRLFSGGTSCGHAQLRGQKIHFYAFAWKRTAPFQGGDRIFVSPSAEEVEAVCPDLVVNVNKLGKVINVAKCPRELLSAFRAFRCPYFFWSVQDFMDFQEGRPSSEQMRLSHF